MRRLTEKDDNGNWRLKGLPWKDLYTGTVITKDIWGKVYVALCKLLEYEETGLDPDEIERMQDGYLPPDRRAAIDRAYADMCSELEACKKALSEQGEILQAYEKDLEGQDGKQGCISCQEYPEGHTWRGRFMRRFTQKE